MLQAESVPITITIKADRHRVSEGQILTALTQARKVFDVLKDQVSAVVS